jgi:hypothetical protein
LSDPGGAADWKSVRVYAPLAGTTPPRGKIIPENGGRDILGRPVAKDAAPVIGAIQQVGQ